MRVLYYNWVDFHDHGLRGGGVSFYQANLIRALEKDPDYDVTFLSSGSAYSPRGGKPRWQKVRRGRNAPATPRFEIVNSGVQAPSHHSFFNPSQVAHDATAEAVFDFIEKNGPFDVVHFNNLEGVPANVLNLKSRFPETRVILSLHNYYPFCPQVNLWAEEEENCASYEDGRHCVVCLPNPPREHSEHRIKIIAYMLENIGLKRDDPFVVMMRAAVMKSAVGLKKTVVRVRALFKKSGAAKPADNGVLGTPLSLAINPARFANRRKQIVELINANCDAVLGVSARVCTIAEHHGIDPAILHTSYIGTQQAAVWDHSEPRAAVLGADGTLTLGYLGYMRRDKGFHFLMHALRGLPKETAGRIRLIAAAKGGERGVQQLELLSSHLKDVYHIDGYSHEELDALLAEVDVGVVPVLWEDNLPQVAIEMHARHIPLLTSNLGGAQELAAFPGMVFEAGSVESFRDRIEAILDGRIDVTSYWENAQAPLTMRDHLDELRGYYSAS